MTLLVPSKSTLTIYIQYVYIYIYSIYIYMQYTYINTLYMQKNLQLCVCKDDGRMDGCMDGWMYGTLCIYVNKQIYIYIHIRKYKYIHIYIYVLYEYVYIYIFNIYPYTAYRRFTYRAHFFVSAQLSEPALRAHTTRPSGKRPSPAGREGDPSPSLLQVTSNNIKEPPNEHINIIAIIS